MDDNSSSDQNSKGPIFKTPAEPTVAKSKGNQAQNNSPRLKIGLSKFTPMPIDQENPNLPRLKSQSPSSSPNPLFTQYQPSPPILQSLNQKKSVISIIEALFLVMVIVFLFALVSCLILAYTNYTLVQPPKFAQDFIDSIIIKTPLPKTPRLLTKQASENLGKNW